jgi:outer membrane receptor protein involved in Fe transport
MKKILTNVLIVLIAAICRAEDEDLPIFESEKIVITATRYEVNRKDVSAVMDVINKDEIEKTNAKTVTEILAKNSSVDVIAYPPALSSVNLRGFAPELKISNIKHHMLLIDGRRAGAVNLSTLLLADIERIEVLKGPASSLYGSEAMAGVINIITRKSQGKIETKLDLEGGSFGYWHSNILTGGAINERLNFDLTLTAKGSHYYKVPEFSVGDWKWKGGTWKGNSYKNYNSSIRLGYNINENHAINVRGDLFLARDVKYFGDIYGTFGPGREDMDRYSIDFSYKGRLEKHHLLIKGFLAKDKDFFYSNLDFQTWSEVPWYKSNLSSSDYAGLQIQNTVEVPVFHQITFGFDYNYDKMNSKVYNPDGSRISPYNPDNDKENYAGFVENRLSLFNNNLILTIGTRYDLYILKSKRTPDFISNQYKLGKETLESVNPRAGFVYKLKNLMRFHSSFGTAFVVPSPIEKAGSYSNWGITYYGNPDLKPEKSLSFDAGCEFTVSSLNMDLTYFHTDVKDKIVKDSVSSNEFTYENIARAEIRGFENTLSFDLGRYLNLTRMIRIYSNATYLFKADDITNSREIYNVAKIKINCGLDYADEKFNGRINFRYVGKMKESNIFTTVYIGETVAYGDFLIADINLGYVLTENISVNCKVNNLFDKVYQEKPGYPMPGRNFSAGIAVKF